MIQQNHLFPSQFLLSPHFALAMTEPSTSAEQLPPELRYIQYAHSLEKQYLPSIRALISKDLSEPYSIYVYRYFLYQWGDLCFMVTTSHCYPLGGTGVTANF